MCGIAGLLDPKIVDKEKVIRGMTSLIAHRGPDEDGFYLDEFTGLGMRRLSIIDLSGGTQPITSSDERYLIFFNGEIYNFQELRNELAGYPFKTHSDTEVILAGFLKWGDKVLQKLRGMFTVAIYDTETKLLLIARDFFGIKPLYYLKYGDRVSAFSSEIKSFFAIPGFKPEVNDAAVYNYLSFQYNPLDESFFKNVYKLAPGHSMLIDLKTGESEIKRYWKFDFNQDENLNEEKTKREILSVMRDSVSHHMIADVPVGSFLSGGIDSSIIATLMQEVREDKKIKTFTVGFDTLSEGREAKETAEPLGTDHTEIKVGAKEYFEALPKAMYHFDEPVADPSAIGIYFLAQEARKHVTVVLSGEGSDEFFGGYNIYLAPIARERLAWVPKFILKLILSLPGEYFGKNYLRRVYRNLEDWYIGNASIFTKLEKNRIWKGPDVGTHSLNDLYAEVRGLSDSTKMQYIDINTWLVGDILAKADKMTMAHSLELRVPFLDVEVAKLASTLPDKFKWKNGATKYLLREAFQKVLPESTRQRKKLGFPTPVKDWFTKDREDIYKTIFENTYIKEKFNLEEIRNIIDEHTRGKKDNARKIYMLLVLAIWYNTFIDPPRVDEHSRVEAGKL